MQIIPITDTYSQTLTVQLGGQSVRLAIYQTTACGLFMDVYVGGVLLLGGVICQDRNPIIRDTYLGFVGDLAFVDQQGDSDPASPGLGSRYLLYYLSAAEAAALA